MKARREDRILLLMVAVTMVIIVGSVLLSSHAAPARTCTTDADCIENGVPVCPSCPDYAAVRP